MDPAAPLPSGGLADGAPLGSRGESPFRSLFAGRVRRVSLTTLAWFEQLRTWLIRETGLRPDRLRAARVIGFATTEEYRRFRLHSSADAYYLGTEGRDYIVMVLAGPNEFGVAAHEYAHMVLHSTGWQLPPWLGEGLAELFSTVRSPERGQPWAATVRSICKPCDGVPGCRSRNSCD